MKRLPMRVFYSPKDNTLYTFLYLTDKEAKAWGFIKIGYL